MDIDMSLDQLAEKDGAQRRRRGKKPGGKAPAQRRGEKQKQPQQQQQRQQHQQRGGRRAFQDSGKPEYVPVVFGNGTPEKVLTGRLNESMMGGKEPVSIVQAALARGAEIFLKNQAARSQGKRQSKTGVKKAGKRPSTGASPRKRPVIQHPLLKKLRIVRPKDPSYERELRQLRNSTYAVRVVHKSQKERFTKAAAAAAADAARPTGRQASQSRRLPMTSSTPVSAGPLSDRFSTLKHK